MDAHTLTHSLTHIVSLSQTHKRIDHTCTHARTLGAFHANTQCPLHGPLHGCMPGYYLVAWMAMERKQHHLKTITNILTQQDTPAGTAFRLQTPVLSSPALGDLTGGKRPP